MEFVRPQLAKSATEKWIAKFVPSVHVAEMKLDGHRRLVHRKGSWSRIGKDHSHPDIEKHVPDGWLLDGEIVPVDVSPGSNVVSHYLAEHPDKLKFVVFDCLWANGQNIMGKDWAFRRAAIEKLFKLHDLGSRMELSEITYMRTKADMMNAMSAASDIGCEGTMLGS